jgi:phage terminase large subunit-like protein
MIDLEAAKRMSVAQIDKLIASWSASLAIRKLELYKPYPKQRQFHASGGPMEIRERLLMAANQVGKTWAAAFETAMHLTGEYPDWWDGAYFDEPTTGWAASETSQSTRDTVQRLLLGQPGAWGTGAIPRRNLGEIKRAAHGVADAVETVMVKHRAGGESRLVIKTYDQGRERWQGETLDFVWLDEEPPEDIYFEALTRTNARNGIVTLTFTPLKGFSNVVRRFLSDKPAGIAVTTMTIEDAEHYTPEQRKAIIATYPEHEREARTMGVPTLGSGRIFPVAEKDIVVAPITIPEHWPRINGLDFGWDHPTAGAGLAWDRDADVVYLTAEYRKAEDIPVVHAAAIKAWGTWIPTAWPHDGLQHDKGSGEALAGQYRRHGLNMLKDKATHAPKRGELEGTGGNGVEAGIQDMLERMTTGRFKVFSTCQMWLEEFRMYHREDGKIVKERDDMISASRYASMMLRHAITKPRDVAYDADEGFQVMDEGMAF